MEFDAARFAAADIDPVAEFDDGRPNVLFVGRLEPRKGFPHLLKAYPQIKRAVPDVRLLVVGAYSEEDKARLIEGIGTNALQDVHWIGRVSAQDLPRYYRTATIFCAPSTGGESFGIVLLEAMAAGAPIVASGIAGYRSVMQAGVQGRFVPPEDEPALAEAIIHLLGDPEARSSMAVRGRETAAQYDWSVVAPRVLSYYQELLDKRPRWRAAPANAPATHEASVSVPDNARVVLDIRGHLKLEGWQRSEVCAAARDHGEVHVEVQGGVVSVTGVTSSQEFVVNVPHRASVHVTYVGGHAQVRGLEEPLEIERVAGHLKLEHIASVDIRSVGGNLSANDVQGSLECRSVLGHLTVHQMTGRLVADAEGHASVDALAGAIKLRVKGKAKVVLAPHQPYHDPAFDEASSIHAGANIELALDPSANATVTIQDGRGARARVFGDGKVSIQLNTPGRVTVNKPETGR